MMAALEDLSPEILTTVLSKLTAKSLLNFSECNKKLNEECLGNSLLWKSLCKHDFDVELLTVGPFNSAHEIYKLIYKARVILEEANHITYSGMLPDWMFTWCILSKQPPSFAFNRLPKGKTKKLWSLSDEQLFYNKSIFHRSFLWREGYDAAITKYGSVLEFQRHTLRRCARSQRRVHIVYPKEIKAKRRRHFQKLKLEDRYSVINEILMKKTGKDQNNEPILMNFEPQKIGEDYIDGKLHRFGKLQLDEYVKFGQQLYDQISMTSDCFSINDIVFCVLLTYEQLDDTVCDHLFSCEEFLSLAQQYESRMSEVWEWQIEKGLNHQIKYRGSMNVKRLGAYKDYIRTGDTKHLETLKAHFQGLENVSLWLDDNQWVKSLLDLPVRAVLEGRKPVIATQRSRIICAKIKLYLTSGKDEHFRDVLKSVSALAKSYLKECCLNVQELDNILNNQDVEISAQIGESSKSEPTNGNKDETPFSTEKTLKRQSSEDEEAVSPKRKADVAGGPIELATRPIYSEGETDTYNNAADLLDEILDSI